jgi:hypothetical protein
MYRRGAFIVGSRCPSLLNTHRSNPYTAAAAAATAARAASGAASTRPGAASAACVDCAASAACACCAASAAAASVSAPSGSKLYAGMMCSGAFLVEDIESRQADVRDFLLSEDYASGVLRRGIADRSDRSGCATRQRQCPGDSQRRNSSSLPTSCLRSLLRARHG